MNTNLKNILLAVILVISLSNSLQLKKPLPPNCTLQNSTCTACFVQCGLLFSLNASKIDPECFINSTSLELVYSEEEEEIATLFKTSLSIEYLYNSTATEIPQECQLTKIFI